MLGRKQLACSFCGKGAADVAKLVAGPKVYICDECVAVVSRIMKGDEPPRLIASSARLGLLGKLWARLHRFLGGERVRRSPHQAVPP